MFASAEELFKKITINFQSPRIHAATENIT